MPGDAADYRLSYGSDALQFGALRLPKSRGPHRIVVFIHGGCWLNRFGLDHARIVSRAIADLGYAVWTPEYRRIGDQGGGWPGTFDDVVASFEALADIAPLHGLDLNHVVVMGHSAGGHLALWLAGRKNLKVKIHGIMALAGISHLLDYEALGNECAASLPLLLEGNSRARAERWLEVDPIRRLPLGVPVSFIHGDSDAIVPLSQSEDFCRAAGWQCTLNVITGGGHFDMVSPFSEAFKVIGRELQRLKTMPRNFSALVREKMLAPDAMFIRCDDGRDFTYAQYWSLSGKIANALAVRGVARGDRVAAQLEKSVEALAIFLACARLGAIFLPLNTAYTPTEVGYFVGDAEPKLVIDEKSFGNFMGLVQDQTDIVPDVRLDWDSPIAILYTSGTTGKSKGALLTHGNLASNALTLVETWKFTAQDVLIHALPIYHTHGLFTAANTVLLSGGSMLFRRKFDVDDVVALLPQATALMGVPTFYTRLVKHEGLTPEHLQHMRLFISGSAPLLAETHGEFEEKTGHAILERYGMTETNMNTSNPFGGERRAGTVGMALAGIEVRVVDPASGEALPPGEIGMIEVRGPNVFKEYWRNPEKTVAEIRPDGFFITGDLGSFDGDGYLTISGRGKDLVITGGFNVYPKEVESEIDLFTEVVESAVIGVPHPDLGEGVVAVVVLAKAAFDEKKMVTELQKRLAKFKVPKRIIAVSELPRNAMGKVQKNKLREAYWDLFKA